MDEKNGLLSKSEMMLESPDYQVSCLSTLKSFLSFDLNNENNSIINSLSTDNDIKPINLFSQFNSTKRLASLRKLMKLNNLTAYIVPSEDEHQSEYTSVKDQRREFITGFTGSSGIAIITLHSAALSTDSRYFIQASNQLDNNWILLKQGIKGFPNWIDWMIDECIYQMDQLGETGDIGVDPKLIDWKLGKNLIEKLHANNLNFINDLDNNLIDLIRGKLINIKINKLIKFPLKYSGLDTFNKINNVRSLMKNDNCFVYISNMLDSIAWLLNLRGNDIQFNPVFFSYIIIYLDKIILYVDKKKLDKDLILYLNNFDIKIKNYNEIWDDLPAISNSTSNSSSKINKICLDLKSSYSIFINIPSIYKIYFRSILTELKGIKNEIEIKNLRESQIIDSLAIVRFLNWFYKNYLKFQFNELDLVDKLFEFRNNSSKFKGLSFQTITASGPNSAIVHYEPTSDNYDKIKMNSILLIDSGGQYFEGTTDITRTIYVYKDLKPTEEMKRTYTLVLNGHLNIAMLKFKFGTSSYYIDKLGRLPLRKYGLDYGHGTGHGIDNYICVHSGPCGLSPSQTSYNYKPLENGNFISNEPGYYKDGEFGIRIESDILVINNDDINNELQFDYLTMVPFCKDLIDIKYLNIEQVKWINEYHERVYQILLPRLENIKDFESINWLREATLPIII